MSRTTPWADNHEWLDVYKKLYSSNRDEQLIGVKRVKAWASRTKLPHSVESTANLVEIAHFQGPPKQLSLLLSMALIRFVNGIVDAGQKGSVACSAVMIAEQLELPIWLVELRHQATHDRIPPLNQLHRARSQALDWLRVFYWEIQATAVQDTKETISALIKEYQDIRKGNLMSAGQVQKVLGNITSILTIENYADILLPLLLEPGVMVMEGHTVDFNTEFLDEDYVIQLWEPLLTCCELQWPGFSGSVVQAVLDAYGSSPDHTTVQYWSTSSTWCKYLMKKYMVPWKAYDQVTIVKSLLTKTNKLHVDLLAYLEHINEIPEQLLHIYQFFCVKYDFEQECDGSDAEMDEDFEEMSRMLEEIENKIPHIEESESEDDLGDVQGWEHVAYWPKCPIGTLPGSIGQNNLDLDPLYDDPTFLQEQGILHLPSSSHVLITPTPIVQESEFIPKVFLI